MSLGLWEVVSWALGNVQVDGHGKGVTRDELAASVYRMEQARADIAERLANSQLTRALAAEAALAEEKDNREKFIAAESRYTDEARRERDDLRAKLVAAEADLLHFMDGTLDYQPLVRERDDALARAEAAEKALAEYKSLKKGLLEATRQLTQDNSKLLAERDAAQARVKELEGWLVIGRAQKAEARVAELEEALADVLALDERILRIEDVYYTNELRAAVAHAHQVLEEKP